MYGYRAQWSEQKHIDSGRFLASGQPLPEHIRLDGADASHYGRDELGAQIGYLPQDIELFAGSVVNNIARREVNAEDVILAAKDAEIHELILQLPDGYDTQLGREGGMMLSWPAATTRLWLALSIGDPR